MRNWLKRLRRWLRHHLQKPTNTVSAQYTTNSLHIERNGVVIYSGPFGKAPPDMQKSVNEAQVYADAAFAKMHDILRSTNNG